MFQPHIANWASPDRAIQQAEGKAFPALTSPLPRLGVVLSARPTAAHPWLWHRGCRFPPSPGPTLSVLHLGAAAPLRLQRLPLVQRRAKGRASPRDLRPCAKPRRAPLPSPPAIPPGSASPRGSRPAPESG
ncbi:hypothetical protein NDU88_001998 [Pleurodeles waltl]|uniref:Uncharacterized protein n=1 Tax=Pleurodeles waltl TaxID=8319 RepID=A0AAV7LZN0_PLEWA|nr:hypothetical protein NDU88_001998 [Pleurodeles waltl]